MALKTIRVSGKKRPNLEFKIELPVMDEETGEQIVDEENPDGKFTEEVFHCRPRIPGALLLDLAAAGTVGDAYQASSMRRFFDYAVIDDDKQRWYALLDNEETPVELEHLGEIMSELMGAYTDRPTESASSSLPGGS